MNPKTSSNNSVDIKARCAQAMVSAGLPIEVLASRHHRADAVDRLCAKIEAQWGQTQLRPLGSSLKLCLIAEGSADLYPRFGPTSEWDTAAAHAIVNESDGSFYKYKDQSDHYYNKENLLNDWFVVESKKIV